MEFRKLVRKKHLELMLRDYREYYPERAVRIGNSSIKKVVRELRSQNKNAKKVVNHVLGVLLYENFYLTRSVLQTNENADELMKLDNSFEAFVKSSFEKHVANCDTTRIYFSLEGTGSSGDACNFYALPHRVMKYFMDNVHPDHHQLLDDCKTKKLLY